MRVLRHLFVSICIIISTLPVLHAQAVPTELAAVPDKVFIVAERADLSASGLFSLVNFDTVAIRVASIMFAGDHPHMYYEAVNLPIELLPNQATQVRVVYTPGGDTTTITDAILVVNENMVSGEVDTLSVPIEASIGPPLPLDTIRLLSERSVGLLPNTIRYILILDSDLGDHVGFAEATFKYKTAELYLGDYTILTDSVDDENVWRYTGLRVVPDDNRDKGDTIADFHFTILHSTSGGSGDTNSVLDLIRVEWFAKFTGNRIYTYTVLDTSVVSDVEDDAYVVQRLNDAPSDIEIAPNPAGDVVRITVRKSDARGPARLTLYTINGIECLSSSDYSVTASGDVTFTLDAASLPSGSYLLRALFHNTSVVGSLTVTE